MPPAVESRLLREVQRMDLLTPNHMPPDQTAPAMLCTCMLPAPLRKQNCFHRAVIEALAGTLTSHWSPPTSQRGLLPSSSGLSLGHILFNASRLSSESPSLCRLENEFRRHNIRMEVELGIDSSQQSVLICAFKRSLANCFLVNFFRLDLLSIMSPSKHQLSSRRRMAL